MEILIYSIVQFWSDILSFFQSANANFYIVSDLWQETFVWLEMTVCWSDIFVWVLSILSVGLLIFWSIKIFLMFLNLFRNILR